MTGGPASAVEQGLLDTAEAAPQDANDKVIRVVGLRAGGSPAVVLLEQRNHPIRDCRQHIAVALDRCPRVRLMRTHNPALLRQGVPLPHAERSATNASPSHRESPRDRRPLARARHRARRIRHPAAAPRTGRIRQSGEWNGEGGIRTRDGVSPILA